MKKSPYLLPAVLILIFAFSRWPGLMPDNFSAVYAMAFCAGIYFPTGRGLLTLFSVLIGTDVAMNLFYYHVSAFDWLMLPNYIAYLLIAGFGRRFNPRWNWLTLVCGGLLGAVIFYLVSNTGAWLQNPEYPRTLAGWIQALTVGTPGWPHTWEFFRNTLLSGGLFTGLFAGAVKLSPSSAPEEKEEEEESEEPEKAKA